MNDSLLTCPFCFEAFEGKTRCPHHDLELVDPLSIGKAKQAWRAWAETGRWLLCIAGMLWLASFVLPAWVWQIEEGVAESAYRLAIRSALSLWLIPFVGIAVAWISLIRPRAWLVRARASMLVFAMAPIAAFWWSHRRILRGVDGAGEMTLGSAWIALAAASVLAVLAVVSLELSSRKARQSN